MSNTTTAAALVPFEYPQMFEFPPFFTRQPTISTWTDQLNQWISLITSYYRSHRLFTIDDIDTAITRLPFSNPRINRNLSAATLVEIIDGMVKSGSAEWITPSKSCIIWWQRAGAWADQLHKYAVDSGLTGSIMTAYELIDDEDDPETDALAQQAMASGRVSAATFRGLPPIIMHRCLVILVNSGKAQTFTQDGGP
ncbi:ESCRT-II complex, vps25 subunit, partial [Ramicandelaber brevisporus]